MLARTNLKTASEVWEFFYPDVCLTPHSVG